MGECLVHFSCSELCLVDEAMKLAESNKLRLAGARNTHGVHTDAGAGKAEDTLVPGTRHIALDELLDKMLAPNPEDRITMEEVLNHPSMHYGRNDETDTDAIGSSELRALIIAIAEGDKAKIIAAQDAFLVAFPGLEISASSQV